MQRTDHATEAHPPRRVLVLTHTGELGGAEAALIRLASAIDRRAFSVEAVLLSAGPLAARLEDIEVPVVVLPSGEVTRVTREQTVGSLSRLWRNFRQTVAASVRIRRLLRERSPDLVVANSLKAAVLLSLATPGSGTRWVWHLHDRISDDYLPAAVVIALRWVARFGPHRVVANSHATARTLGQRVGRSKHVVVAYPGLEPHAFDEPRRRGGGRTIGLIGRVSATKGQREFLSAAELIHSSAPHLRFRIIGAALFDDAVEESRLRALSTASRAAGRIEWRGWVADPSRELRRLRILVHASPVPEPFGQVIVEAMAAGVPVVATNAGGVPEILDPGGVAVLVAPGVHAAPAGVLVRPGDPEALARGILWLLEHPARAADVATFARGEARKRFTIDRTKDVVERAWFDSARPRPLRRA